MPLRKRSAARQLAELEAARAGGAGEHMLDMAVSLRVCDVEGTGPGARFKLDTDQELLRVGGRWDRRRKDWTGEASSCVVFRLHRGQEQAARWLAEWVRRSATGDWTDFARAWTCLLIGGRRSGKSDLAVKLIALFAIFTKRSICWLISPTLEAGAELDRALQELLPRAWYRRKEAATGSALTYTLANGSRLLLRSGFKPGGLRAGRADMVLLNEMQELEERAFVNVRGAVVDQAGIVIGTANPPDKPRGRFLEKLFHAARAGRVEAAAFELDPLANPFVEHASLLALEHEVDAKTFDRDVRGLFTPIGDVVMHAWSDLENWRDPPTHLVDITPEVTKRLLGRAAGDVVGMDFQRIPGCVATVLRLYRDPSAPAEILVWVVDEVVVDDADEFVLVDALEATPRFELGDKAPEKRDRAEGYTGTPSSTGATPTHAAAVVDASAWYQDGAHTQGRTSDRMLKSRRWTDLHRPQPDSDRNPAIIERMKTANALLRSADGTRRLFVARHCERTAEAMRLYPMKFGKPDRRHELAHVIDAVTYPLYRLFGRPVKKSTAMGPYFGIRRTRADEMKGW